MEAISHANASSSDCDSILYWKTLAEKYKKSLEAAQDELEEFQSSSRDLELEMEKQLEGQDKKLNDLSVANQRQAAELDCVKTKYMNLQAEYRGRVDGLEQRLEVVLAERDAAQGYIRELEQLNDDLERAKRSLVVSLEDFERRMNEAIERNAFLESELDDKDTLVASVQRLKEETKDLRQELQVRERCEPGREQGGSVCAEAASPLRLRRGNVANAFSFCVATAASSSSAASRPSALDVSPIVHSDAKSPSRAAECLPVAAFPVMPSASHAQPLIPSARISALNIVGDLLRKVGALESKLANCRRFAGDANIESPSSPKYVGSKAVS